MERIIRAFFHSWAGWSHAIRTEQAVRQEAIVLAVALPVAFLITDDAWKRLALIGVLLVLLSVEFLNTAIEKLADHVRPDMHPHIKVVKDLGSAAVFMLIVLSGLVWAVALWECFA